MQIFGRRISIAVCVLAGIAMVILMYASDKLTGSADWSPTAQFFARCLVGLPAILTAGLWPRDKRMIEAKKTATP